MIPDIITVVIQYSDIRSIARLASTSRDIRESIRSSLKFTQIPFHDLRELAQIRSGLSSLQSLTNDVMPSEMLVDLFRDRTAEQDQFLLHQTLMDRSLETKLQCWGSMFNPRLLDEKQWSLLCQNYNRINARSYEMLAALVSSSIPLRGYLAESIKMDMDLLHGSIEADQGQVSIDLQVMPRTEDVHSISLRSRILRSLPCPDHIIVNLLHLMNSEELEGIELIAPMLQCLESFHEGRCDLSLIEELIKRSISCWGISTIYNHISSGIRSNTLTFKSLQIISHYCSSYDGSVLHRRLIDLILSDRHIPRCYQFYRCLMILRSRHNKAFYPSNLVNRSYSELLSFSLDCYPCCLKILYHKERGDDIQDQLGILFRRDNFKSFHSHCDLMTELCNIPSLREDMFKFTCSEAGTSRIKY